MGKQEYFATKKGSLENIAVINLINEGPASASEITRVRFKTMIGYTYRKTSIWERISSRTVNFK